jgi:DNA-binding GntR family transcriptional regulator
VGLGQQAATGLLAARAFEAIRDQIISLRLAPGVPLDEGELARTLGIGRGPVREAIKRLAHERLAVVYPRRGTFVAEITISDERWLTEVRGPLEGLAAALAAVRATSAERDELDRLQKKLEVIHGSDGLLELDAKVHRTLHRAAHNPVLQDTLDQYFNLALRIWYFVRDRLPSIDAHVLNQRIVIDAVMRGDPETAREAAEKHLSACTLELRSIL